MTPNTTTPPASLPLTTDRRTARVIEFFETLRLESLASLPSVYTPQAQFIDPFNDVLGHSGITRVFEHMFAQVHQPRFEVLEAITEDNRCFLLWNFYFRSKARAPETCVHGGSFLRYGPCGRVAFHRDHWDPVRELYEGIPLLGALMRWVRRRLSAHR